MNKEEQLAIATDIFAEPGRKVTGVDNSNPPTLIVSFEDNYGRQDCTMELGDLYDEVELRRSLETFRQGRASKIGEWEYQKKLSSEIVDHLRGAPDPNNRMRWMPKLVAKRFVDDFRVRFPELEQLVENAGNANRDAVIAELESIPFSWQKSP